MCDHITVWMMIYTYLHFIPLFAFCFFMVLIKTRDMSKMKYQICAPKWHVAFLIFFDIEFMSISRSVTSWVNVTIWFDYSLNDIDFTYGRRTKDRILWEYLERHIIYSRLKYNRCISRIWAEYNKSLHYRHVLATEANIQGWYIPKERA